MYLDLHNFFKSVFLVHFLCSMKRCSWLKHSLLNVEIHGLHLPHCLVAEDLSAPNHCPVLTIVLLQVFLSIVRTVQLEISKILLMNVFYLVWIVVLLPPGVLACLVPDHNPVILILHHKNIVERVAVAKNFV